MNEQEGRYRDLSIDMLERGFKHNDTIERLGVRYFIDAKAPWFSFEERKLNVSFTHRELLWYVRGDRGDSSIGEYARIWRYIFDRDGYAASNYGHVLFKEYRLMDAANMLKEDPGTRRAVVYIGDNSGVNLNRADVPCTTSMQFIVRDGFLHSFVNMRSQDLIFGLGNDAVFFSLVHLLVARAVGVVPTGTTMMIGSLHVYERHHDMLGALLNPTSIEIPWRQELLGPAEANQILTQQTTSGKFMTWVKEQV